jgi:hypothetical protein
MQGFESREGGFSFNEFGTRSIAPFFSTHWMAVCFAIVILVVLVIAFFFGYIGTSAKKVEGMSVLTKIVRDGPGESLTAGTLETGYAADSTAFCAGAGEATNDPYDYLRATVNDTTAEGFAPFPGYQTRLDQALAQAAQH